MNMLPTAVTMQYRASRCPAPRVGSRRWIIRTVAVLLAACAAPVLALPPTISHRYVVENPYQWVVEDERVGSYFNYRPSTAVAASNDFALLGNGVPAGYFYHFGAEEEIYYTANPVSVVYRPWLNGGTRMDINPPANSPDGERFGQSLAIHGNRVAIGSAEVWGSHNIWQYSGGDPVTTVQVVPRITDGGRVHLFQFNGTSFEHEYTIVHDGLNREFFGISVALNATHLLVGRPGIPNAGPAAADLFDLDTGTLVTTFISPLPTEGTHQFGYEVALSGDLAIVGAYGWNTVFVYRHDGAGTWNAAGELTSPGGLYTNFGVSIAVDGERILVGAPGMDRAYIFEDDGDDDWPVVAELSGGTGSRFGASVALVGDSAFIGAPNFTYGPLARTGIVVRHDRASDGTWPFTASKTAETPETDDRFGTEVAASTKMLVVRDTKNTHQIPDEMSIFTGPPPGC